ncbi:MAG TPA: N-acetylglucosamine-6-phosphate deacetylase [Lachnospiraceae bacterium]|nr:N-acetylglucosamine-6-phosphate deacetylase [Lachnospiraceae bacterium]
MIIKNVYAYTKEHEFCKKDIIICNGRITEDTLLYGQKEIIDGTGLFAIPGLVDIHLHGAVGHDFCDADEDGLQKIACFEAQNGVLAICPATMSYPEEVLNGIIDTAVAHKNRCGADLAGIHLEGPFINPDMAGAQNPKYLAKPDIDMFKRLQKRAKGLIKLVSIAPELDGAMEFTRLCRDMANISIAHTCADYEITKKAFALGARHMTHLYNAMPGIGHRDPGPVTAAWEQGAEAELIADGVHIHPAVVRLTFNVFGPEHIILVSDSMMACGLSDGQYQLGGQKVNVHGKRAVLAGHPKTIAGSVTNLFECMRNAVIDMGIPLEYAVRAACENPAKAIGIYNDYGSLEPGHYGNVVLIDKDIHICHIIQKGSILK